MRACNWFVVLLTFALSVSNLVHFPASIVLLFNKCPAISQFARVTSKKRKIQFYHKY